VVLPDKRIKLMRRRSSALWERYARRSCVVRQPEGDHASRRQACQYISSQLGRKQEPSSEMAMPVGPFKIVMPRGRRVPVIAHVPHASIAVPPCVRSQIVLDDRELEREIARLTDWDVDDLFSWVLDLGGCMFVSTLSRLVFDPERFVNDDEEPMAAVGQGVVYTRTTDGSLMATISAEERAARVQGLYEPYHEGLSALVTSVVDSLGTAILLDCHSFPTTPLPSELDQAVPRPDICIGTDPFHTPEALANGLALAFESEGLRVQRDSPFAGTLVPLDFLGRDSRVRSVMIEVRRGPYCDEETGRRSRGFESARAAIERAVTAGVAGELRTG
jgi:N-formylglutamate deformylase